ncbi:MAG: plasmid stabilization system [Candidatus Parabeggiatoa sp. nov. 2]|nr:MAG: plasmid stabilization system [Gammaproteobacteria bacterium]
MTGKIDLLGLNPDEPKLDIKRPQGENFYRLRVGDWRVIFDRQDVVKVITIEKN